MPQGHRRQDWEEVRGRGSPATAAAAAAAVAAVNTWLGDLAPSTQQPTRFHAASSLGSTLACGVARQSSESNLDFMPLACLGIVPPDLTTQMDGHSWLTRCMLTADSWRSNRITLSRNLGLDPSSCTALSTHFIARGCRTFTPEVAWKVGCRGRLGR
jgi:hypothetical protein